MEEHDNHSHDQQYDPSAMQTDSELNTILAGMPTPVSNDIHATDQSSFMSPLQVDQQGYDGLDGHAFTSNRNDEVCPITQKLISRCSLRLYFLRRLLRWI